MANDKTPDQALPPTAGAPTLPGKMTANKQTPTTPTETLPLSQPPTVTTADDVVVAPLDIDTPQSDAAIDDIVAQEADEVLAAEDAGLAQAQLEAESVVAPTKRSHPVFWFFVLLLATLAIIFGALLVMPSFSFAP